MAMLLALGATCAGAATFDRLPRVYIEYPDGTFERSPLEVRPPAIRLSEDGNGLLTNLDWSTWTRSSARATGLQGGSLLRGKYRAKVLPGTIRLHRSSHCDAERSRLDAARRRLHGSQGDAKGSQTNGLPSAR
jgi:hypothetical protein